MQEWPGGKTLCRSLVTCKGFFCPVVLLLLLYENDYFSHFVSFHVIVSLFVIICHCLILCRSCPYFCLIPRHDDSQQDHFKCFVFFFHFSFVLFIVSNIPRHDVTINMIEEMTATVVQLQEENRYFYTALTFYNPICRN